MTRDAFEALERLAGGLGTAFLALTALLYSLLVGAACLIGIGLPLLPLALALNRAVADRERGRLSRMGHEMVSPYLTTEQPAGWAARVRAARDDPATLRDLRWLALHATLGLILGIIGVALPVQAVREMTFPLWWQLPEPQERTSSLGVLVDSWPGAIAVALSGLLFVAASVLLGSRMAALQARPGVRLLNPHPSVDLSARVAQLTATRAGALTAHAAELRRIERSLHDGAQNRLVGVVVMLAAARRALARDQATAEPVLVRAQDAAEEALAELRGVVRGILPPILEDRGLSGALAALAAGCPVPCRISMDELGRVPLSVETTAYFAVAEALTNVTKHSRANHALVEVRLAGKELRITVSDDGIGGASEGQGSGLAGIRRRVDAHDGSMRITSPPGGPTTMEVRLPCAS